VVLASIALMAIALVVAPPPAEATGPHNQYLAVNVGADALFNIGAYPDAAGGSTTGSWDLSFRWPQSPWSSYTTIRVDGSNYRYGSSGTQVTPPTDAGVTNTSAWQTTADVKVTQLLTLVDNPATGRQDVVRIAYTVQNTGAVAHDVGLRLMIDTEVNYNDSALFRVPGVGALTTEREFLGAAIPRGTYVFYDLADATHVAYVATRFAGPAPDRMVFARWGALSGAPWDYIVDPAISIGDSAYGIYWDAATLAPGQSRTYVSSYGLGASDVDPTPPLALGVYGPSQLEILDDDYSPNPFDVTAWVSDVGTGPATNVTATIALSDGLQLVGGAATQNLGGLAVNEEKQASWSVSALPQGSDRTVTYSVTVACDGVAPKTVTRQLVLPAIVTPAPTVTSFTPATGPVGTSVTVTGANFTGATSVTFNGTAAASFSVVSATQITATVPAGATTGPIVVTTPPGVGTSLTDFFVVPVPVITSFTPTTGPVGTVVTVAGTGFIGATSVTFNGLAGTGLTVDSAAQVRITVPVGATSGPLSVTTSGGTGTSVASFTVVPAKPTIIKIKPVSGKRGATVTITGTNFGALKSATSSVKFGSKTCTKYVSWNATQIKCKVPTTAKYGAVKVTVKTAAGTSNAKSFTVKH
jgi:hypothetical protein